MKGCNADVAFLVLSLCKSNSVLVASGVIVCLFGAHLDIGLGARCLFACCRYRDIMVGDCWNQEWDVSFRRTFGTGEVREWNRLLQKLDGVLLSDQTEQVSWKLEKKGMYTTKSMYRFITFGGVIDKRARKLWKNKMALKLRVFVWQAVHNRLQTGVTLRI